MASDGGKNRVGRPAHKPTDETRRLVATMSGLGATQEFIALKIGISIDSLARHYRQELDMGKGDANTKIATALFKKAIGGNVVAMIFWLKTQARWKETQVNEHVGQNGGPIQLEEIDLSKLSDAALAELMKARPAKG